MGLFARLAGIFFSPRETMAAVAAHPRWLGMFVLVLVISVGPVSWLVTTGPGRNAAIDQNAKYTRMFAFLMTPEQLQEAQDRARQAILDTPGWRMALQTGIGAVIFAPIVSLVISGLLYLVFKTAMGGEARFKQVFAVVVHAGAVSGVKALLLTPLNYFRETFDSATTLRIFLPMIEDDTLLARLLGAVDLFTLWWIFVLAVGLAVLFKRKTTPVAVSLFVVYGVFALGFAAVAAMFAARS